MHVRQKRSFVPFLHDIMARLNKICKMSHAVIYIFSTVLSLVNTNLYMYNN